MNRIIKRIVVWTGAMIVALVLLVIIGVWTGFIVIENNASGYDFLDDAQKERVLEAATIDGLKADGNVYRVKPAQMKQYLDGRGKVVVYSFIPFCKGKVCINPSVAYSKCTNAGVEMVLIAENFDMLFENTTDYPQPVFVIDNQFLGSNSRENYVRLFYDSLTGHSNWSRYDGLFYCFDHGQFIKICGTIDEAIRCISNNQQKEYRK